MTTDRPQRKADGAVLSRPKALGRELGWTKERGDVVGR